MFDLTQQGGSSKREKQSFNPYPEFSSSFSPGPRIDSLPRFMERQQPIPQPLPMSQDQWKAQQQQSAWDKIKAFDIKGLAAGPSTVRDTSGDAGPVPLPFPNSGVSKFLQRSSWNNNPANENLPKPDAPLPLLADLFGGVQQFSMGGKGGVGAVGQKVFDTGAKAIADVPSIIRAGRSLPAFSNALRVTASKVGSDLPFSGSSLSNTMLGMGAGGASITAADALVNNRDLTLEELAMSAGTNALIGGAFHLGGKGVELGSNKLADIKLDRKINKLITPVEVNPLADVQNAYRTPIALRDVQSQQINDAFADTTNNLGRIGPTLPRQGMTPAELLQQKQVNAQSVFGGPLKGYRVSSDTQDAIAEITAKMDNQVNDVTKTLRQMDSQTSVETVRSQIQKMGGIKQGNADIFEEQKVIPNWIRNNRTGQSLDKVADELGMTTDELLTTVNSEKFKPKNYDSEASKVLANDPEYQALSNTLDMLKEGLPPKRTLASFKSKRVGSKPQFETMPTVGTPPGNVPDIKPMVPQEITIPFRKNTEKAPKITNDKYAQSIEPKGDYINFHEPSFGTSLPNYEYGDITFKNPLVVEYGSTGHGGWKTKLSEQYGGKKGNALTNAIKKDGYDGIITIDKGKEVREIVNIGGVKSNMGDPISNQTEEGFLKALSPTVKITSNDEFIPRELSKSQPVEAQVYRGKSASDSGYSGVSRYGEGTYYSNSPQVADIFAKNRGEGSSVEKSTVRLEKPFINESLDATSQEYKNLYGLLKQEGLTEYHVNKILSGEDVAPFDAIAELFTKGDKAKMWAGSNKANELIKESGYDGIIGNNRNLPDMPNHIEIVKFDKVIASNINDAVTGAPISINAFHGSGGAKGQTYNGFDSPIVGEGKYYALDEQTAKSYGKKVTNETIKLDNPIVIKNDTEWNNVIREAKLEMDNPAYFENATDVKEWTEQLQSYVKGEGHDGIVLNFDKEGYNPGTDTLYNVFGHNQVVSYGKPSLKPITKADINLKPRELAPTFATEPLPTQRTPLTQPERMTWTNRDSIPSAGPAPIRSITSENVGQLPSGPIESTITSPAAPQQLTSFPVSPELKQLYRDHRFETGQGHFAKAQKIEQSIKEQMRIDSLSSPAANAGSPGKQLPPGAAAEVRPGINPPKVEETAPRQKVGQEATDYVREQNLLENSDNWKDKKPLSLQTETWGRNIIDIAGKKDGEKIKAAIFDPIHTNEADFMRYKNTERQKIKWLNLSSKERSVVQQVGEGKLDITHIPAGMSADKIRTAISTFREIYDNAINMANESLTRNGYKPVGKLENYFPHFEGDDPLMKALGIKINLVDLPTDINGLSHTFRPGKNWVGNFLHRTGDKTTFDAVEGFDRYIESVGKVIFHTDDVQRLRAFEREIRMKYSPEEIQGQVQSLIDNKTISKDIKDVAIEDLLGRDSTHLSNSVSDIQEFTNVLAGKKDLADRAEERRFGRQIYNAAAFIENRIGANMVRFNPGTWITQFIPVTQSLATTNKVAVAQAMKDTMRNIFKNDGFINRSEFLTNRVGSDILSKGITEKLGDKLSAPMRWVDQFSSQVVTRSKYLEGIKQGMPPTMAMDRANDWAAKLMGDRSVGATPTIFNQLNPVTKLFTQFQLEVKNQISFITKDMPREYLKDGKTVKNVARLTSAVTQLMVYSWIYNQMFEALTGRRPALDPIGIAVNLGKDLDNPNLTTSKAIGNLGSNIGQQVPFVGGVLFNGGRIPISAALKPIASLPGNVLKMATDENGPKEGAKEALGNLGTAAAYIVPPFGGGQVKKMLESYKQLRDGGEFQGGKMKFPVASTPSNIAKGYIFGPSAFKETRDYYDNTRTPLTSKQTDNVSKSMNIGDEYLRTQNTRKVNSLKQKINDVKKDNTLSILKRQEQIDELKRKLAQLGSY